MLPSTFYNCFLGRGLCTSPITSPPPPRCPHRRYLAMNLSLDWAEACRRVSIMWGNLLETHQKSVIALREGLRMANWARRRATTISFLRQFMCMLLRTRTKSPFFSFSSRAHDGNVIQMAQYYGILMKSPCPGF